MKKFYLIIFTVLFFQLSVLAQFNVCPSGTYTRGVVYAHAVDDQIYWASRRDVTGTVVTTDGGNTWTVSSFSDPAPVYCIHAFNADTAFVVASTIYKTTDRGTAWTPISGVFTNSASFPNTIHFFDQNNGLAMGDPVDGYFEIYTTADGGTNWTRVPSSNIPAPLTGEFGVVNCQAYFNDSYWFTTNSARIFRSTDRGFTWTSYQFPQATGQLAVVFRDEIHGIADPYNGINFDYYNTSDGGSTWNYVSSMLSWMYAYAYITYVPGTQSTYMINSISYSGKALRAMALFTNDDGLTWHRMDDWGPYSSGDFVDYGQWTSVNSGWGSFYGANQGNIYHWPGYNGKHIWRAGNSIKYVSIELGAAADTFAISVGNYGTLPTTINNLTLSSNNFSLVNPPALPIVLQPWNAIDLDITFTPQARGLINDSLLIFSDAENYSTLSVLLTGRALQFTPPLPDLIYSASDSLYTSSLSNLNTSSVGWFEGSQIQGLAIRPTDSVLVGISTGATSTLYKIDPIIGGGLPLITIPIANIRAIAFNSSGTLFAGKKTGVLYKININTGEVIQIGTASGKPYSSFSFSPLDGKLYASVIYLVGTSKDAIYTVDTLTGAATLLGLTGDGKSTPAIAFNTDGTLYGLKGTLNESNKLITINTTNGSGSEIGSLGKSGLQAIIMRNVVTDVKENNEGAGVTSYELLQNYPNPWNPITTIGYSLKENIQVKLTLLNILGEELMVLVNEEQNKGYHKLEFNGAKLSSGVYFYRLQAGDFIQTRKMILLK